MEAIMTLMTLDDIVTFYRLYEPWYVVAHPPADK